MVQDQGGTTSNTIPMGVRGELPFGVLPPSSDGVDIPLDLAPLETFPSEEVRIEPILPSESPSWTPTPSPSPSSSVIQLQTLSPVPLLGPTQMPSMVPVISILAMLLLVGAVCFRRCFRWTQT